MSLAFAIATVLIGCGINNVFVELIISPKRNPDADPNAGALLTFLQFVTLAIVSSRKVVAGWIAGKKLTVPLKHYMLQALIFFTMGFVNNWVFAFHISQPLHMVVRSSSLVASAAVGYLVYNRRYSKQEVITQIMITVGVLVATAAEALQALTLGQPTTQPSNAAVDEAMSASDAASKAASDDAFLVWCIGVSLLILVLLLSAFMGQYQQFLKDQFGANEEEAMFMNHALSLPSFAIAAGSLFSSMRAWSASTAAAEALPALFGGTEAGFRAWTPSFVADLPVMWLYVIGNVLTQYIGMLGVYSLAARSNAITLTMTLTVRKCLSLLFSIWFFGNTFTIFHRIGASLVFAGAFWYSFMKQPTKPVKPLNQPVQPEPTEVARPKGT